MPIFCTSLIHWNVPNAWYVTFGMSTCPGVRAGNEHLTESVQNLPKELVIPNDQIKLLNSIGQGEPSCMDHELALAGTAIVSMCTCLVLHNYACTTYIARKMFHVVLSQIQGNLALCTRHS